MLFHLSLAHFFLRKKPVGWRPGDSIGQMLLHNPSQCQLLHDCDDTLSEGGLREQPLGFHGKHQPSNQICHVGHLEPLPDDQDGPNHPPSGVHTGPANHSHVSWSCFPLHRKHCSGFTLSRYLTLIFSQGSVCLKKIPLSLRTLFRKTSVQLPHMETLLCGILR